MLKPRKAKTSLAIVTRYSSGLKGFPEGFAVYLGKKKLEYIDGNKVGEIIRPLTTKMEPIFGQPKIARIIYRTLQTGFCKATIGMGTKYYGLRKLNEITRNKETYIEELQESLFGKPDYSHIGINASNDEGNTSTMDRLTRKIANNPGVSGAFDRRLGDRLRSIVGINEGDEAVARTVAMARMITPHLHDPYAFSRALRNGEPVLYMDTEMPMDMSGLEKLCVPGVDPQEVFARYVKQRQKGEGQEFTIDSLSQANSLLKGDDNA